MANGGWIKDNIKKDFPFIKIYNESDIPSISQSGILIR